MTDKEWGTLMPNGKVCQWETEEKARHAHSIIPSHPIVYREVGKWTDEKPTEPDSPERTLTDAEAIDKIVARYKDHGEQEIFGDSSSLIEFIGDTLEETGRQTWFERPGYLDEED